MSEDEIGQPRSDPNRLSYQPLSQDKEAAVEKKTIFSCKFCKTKFPLMIQKKAHSIPKEVPCSRCGYVSQSKCEFYKHRAEHEKNTCKDCGDELITTWADHKRRRRVMCFLGSCLGLGGSGKDFLSNCSYQRHVNSAHGGGSQVIVSKALQIGDIIVGTDNNNHSSSSPVSCSLSQRTKRSRSRKVSMGNGITADCLQEENNGDDESTSGGEKLDPGPVIVSTRSLRVRVRGNRGRGKGRGGGGSEIISVGGDGRGSLGGRGRGVGGRGRHRGVGGRGSGGSKGKQDQTKLYKEKKTGTYLNKVLHDTDQLLHDADEHFKTSFSGTLVVEKNSNFFNGLYNRMDVENIETSDSYIVSKSPEIEETILGM